MVKKKGGCCTLETLSRNVKLFRKIVRGKMQSKEDPLELLLEKLVWSARNILPAERLKLFRLIWRGPTCHRMLHFRPGVELIGENRAIQSIA